MTLLGGPGAFLKPTGAPRFLIKDDQTDSLSGLPVVTFEWVVAVDAPVISSL